jgi:polyisoprenoid-binding protein YceI
MDTGGGKSLRIKIALIILSSLFFHLEIFADSNSESWLVDLSTCEHQVEFELRGFPDVISVFGSVKKKQESILKGQLEIANGSLSGAVEIGLETTETGIAKQDLLMKKNYLETDKWKTARFTVSKVTIPGTFSPSQFSAKTFTFEGILLLHGATRKVSGTADLQTEDQIISLRFLFDTDMTDYGIALPQYFGMKLDGNVQVTAGIKGKLQRSPNKNEPMP